MHQQAEQQCSNPGATEASGNQAAGIMSSPLTGLVTDKHLVTGGMHNSSDGSSGFLEVWRFIFSGFKVRCRHMDSYLIGFTLVLIIRLVVLPVFSVN